MARYKSIPIDDALNAKELGQKIIDALANGFSIEVLDGKVDDDKWQISELRVWNGRRRDRSNAEDADPSSAY